MKQTILFIFTLLFVYTSFSQVNFKGKILNTDNNVIPSSSIISRDKEGKIINGVVSSLEGDFEIVLNLSQVEDLLITSLGYKDKILTKKELESSETKVFVLEKKTTSLKEIEVISDKPIFEQKADKLVFNLKNSLSTSGSDITEALQMTPGVLVSSSGLNKIGSGEYKVMVNSKLINLSGENLINYLGSIQSDTVSKLEIYDTPPANFDSEGESGIINIVLNKVRGDKELVSAQTSYKQGVYPVGNTLINYIYGNNNLSINLELNGKTGREFVEQINLINYDDGSWNSEINKKNYKESFGGRFAIDYLISKKFQIGLDLDGFSSKPNIDLTNLTQIESNSQLYENINANTVINAKNSNASLNINATHKIDTLGTKYTISLGAFNFKNNQQAALFNEFKRRDENLIDIANANNNSNQNIRNYSGQLDFTIPFKESVITTGLKLLVTESENEITYNNSNTNTIEFTPSQEDLFNYRENIYALYADYSQSFSKTISLKTGLRYENTQTKGNSIQNLGSNVTLKYDNFFPFLGLNVKVNSQNSLALNYSRRIKRPGFYDVNPYRWYTNAYSYAQGNPFLQPSITDIIQISHVFKRRFRTALFFKYSDDSFGQIPLIEETTNEQFYFRENYYTTKSLGFSHVFNIKPLSWWTNSSQFYLIYNDTELLDNIDIDTDLYDGLIANIKFNNSFTISSEKSIKSFLNINYMLPAKYQLYESTSSFNLSLGMSAKITSNFDISILLNDVTNQSNSAYTTFTNDIKQVYDIRRNNRFIRLTAKYNFGNKKLNKIKNKGTAEEIKQRSKN